MLYHVAVTVDRIDPLVVEMAIEANSPTEAEAMGLTLARTMGTKRQPERLNVTAAHEPIYVVHVARVSTSGT